MRSICWAANIIWLIIIPAYLRSCRNILSPQNDRVSSRHAKQCILRLSRAWLSRKLFQKIHPLYIVIQWMYLGPSKIQEDGITLSGMPSSSSIKHED
ncbi:hypothetical protein CDAR_185081 [Caerostris darwini]|uniref:Secreted protein n=1 Tax=Caerostris darwini TaxID=1538125 RepID=A0AAV4STB9_9ARAC|nr:hypothetical protein CDAR_185081 [Caerostris darwini]